MPKNQNQCINEHTNKIIELYSSGKTLSELSNEYGICKLTISGWI